MKKLFILLLLASGCSQPAQVAEQKREQFVLPEYPTNTVMNLNDLDFKMLTFSGGLVFWDNDIKAEQLKIVIQATKEYNKAQVDLVHMSLTQIAPLTTKIDELKKQRDENQKAFASSAENRQAKAVNAKNWFGNALEKETEDNKTRAQTVFASYCDAKIFEYAMEPQNISRFFISRPTTAAICEGFFENQNYFSDTTCSTTNENFYACYYSAMKKTALFNNMTPKAKSAFDNLAADDMIFLLSNDTPKQTAIQFRNKVLGGGLIYDKTGKLLATIAHNANTECLGNIEIGGKSYPKKGHIAECSTPAVVVSRVESPNNLPPNVNAGGYHFFANSPEDMLRAEGLAVFLNRMSSKELLGAGISANDVGFNRPIEINAASLDNDFSELATLIPEIFSVINPDVALKNAEIDTIFQEIQGLKIAPSTNVKRTFDARMLAIAQPKNPGSLDPIVKAFYPRVGLRIEPMDSLRKIYLNLNEKGDTIVGCFNPNGNSEALRCADDVKEQQLEAHIQFDSVSGKLTLTLPLKTSLRLGFNDDTRNLNLNTAQTMVESKGEIANEFTLFSENELKDHVLVLEMFANRWRGVLPFWSGKAFIKDSNGVQKYEGTVSYLTDQSVN